MNDITEPNNRNLRALLHEAGHAVVGKEAPGLVRAVDKLATDLLDGQANITEEHLRRPEEATVELLAMRLQDEGFGARSPSVAERLVRFIKDLYYRAGLSLHRNLRGGEVNGDMALAYAEASRASSWHRTVRISRVSCNTSVVQPSRQWFFHQLHQVLWLSGRGGDWPQW